VAENGDIDHIFDIDLMVSIDRAGAAPLLSTPSWCLDSCRPGYNC
jgi:hypothetical protein